MDTTLSMKGLWTKGKEKKLRSHRVHCIGSMNREALFEK